MISISFLFFWFPHLPSNQCLVAARRSNPVRTTSLSITLNLMKRH